MRPLHSLLVAVALALACLLGWFLVRSSPTRMEVASATPGAPAGEAGVDAAGPTALVPAGPASVLEAPGRAARESAPAPAAPERASGPSDGDAGSWVVGQVVDEAGAPVAGALVYGASSSRGLGVFGGVPLDARGAGDWSWLRRVETTSSPDGRFELAGMRPGTLRLAVRQAGFAPYDGERALPDEERVDLGAIRLELGAQVTGRVVDARGNPVAGAEVVRVGHVTQALAFGGIGSRSGAVVATTDDAGGFHVDQLAVGPWALRVESERHPHALANGTTSSPGERVEGLVVALEDGEEIHGLVRDLPSDESFVVRALPRGTGPEDVPVAQLSPPAATEPRETDVAADGTFRVVGLRRGHSYELGLTRRAKPGPFGFSWSPALATAVRARAGERGVELVYQPESALVFQALDARTSLPIEGFQVEAGIDWPLPQMGEDGRPLLARPEGRARVGNLRPRSSSDKASLRIAAVGYAPYEADGLPLLVGQDTDLGPIYLEPLPLLSVRVVDAATGEPLEGAGVTLSEVEPQRRGGSFRRSIEIDIEAESTDEGLIMPGDTRQSAHTDADGVARLTIPVGASCRLSVRHQDHAPWRSEVFPAPSEAAEREVRMGRGGEVTARLLGPDGEPVAGGRIEHQAPGADGGFRTLVLGGRPEVTNAEGLAVFEHLEPGTHRFRRAREGGAGFFSSGGDAVMVRMAGMPGQDRGWVEALVSEGSASEVELVAPPEHVVAGRVREAGEPLAGATVALARREDDGDGLAHMPLLGGGGPRAETDGQGRYRLEGIEPGEYTLSVRHPSRAMPTELELLVREADVRQDVDLSVAIVEGRVTDEAGEPLAGVRVWPQRARAQGSPTMVAVMAFASNDGGSSMVSLDDGGFAGVRARTDADGRYQLRGIAPQVELQVHAEGEGVQPARSDPLQVAHDEVRRGVDLVLKTAGQIEVRAMRPDGNPARNLLLTLVLEDGAEGAREDRRTELIGEEGRALVDSLAPGTWHLSVRVLGPEEGDPVPDQTVVVRAGEKSEATFTVP